MLNIFHKSKVQMKEVKISACISDLQVDLLDGSPMRALLRIAESTK